MAQELFKELRKLEIACVTSEQQFCVFENAKFINDARSAAFYAFGKAIREEKPVALIIDGETLPSVLTAATEAWFQKANVIIIACFSNYINVHSEYFERCVTDWYTVENISSELLNNCVGKKGPVLINLIGCAEIGKEGIEYGIIPQSFESEKLYLYHPNREYSGSNIKVIEARHRYGVLSRYMGMMAVAESQIYLCCSVDCLLLDLNVFNNRYSVFSTRIIVLDPYGVVKEKKIDSWLESNGVKVIFSVAADKEVIKQLKESQKAMILVVGKAVA